MGDNAQMSDVGGIDLNPNMLDLETQGKAIEFDIPFDSETILNMPIDGFSPIIFQITPINNVPFLLGISEKEEQPKGT